MRNPLLVLSVCIFIFLSGCSSTKMANGKSICDAGQLSCSNVPKVLDLVEPKKVSREKEEFLELKLNFDRRPGAIFVRAEPNGHRLILMASDKRDYLRVCDKNAIIEREWPLDKYTILIRLANMEGDNKVYFGYCSEDGERIFEWKISIRKEGQRYLLYTMGTCIVEP